ncbi:hypothetical protein GOP47_0026878, partial [Adiantum capillus-veneris]
LECSNLIHSNNRNNERRKNGNRLVNLRELCRDLMPAVGVGVLQQYISRRLLRDVELKPPQLIFWATYSRWTRLDGGLQVAILVFAAPSNEMGCSERLRRAAPGVGSSYT